MTPDVFIRGRAIEIRAEGSGVTVRWMRSPHSLKTDVVNPFFAEENTTSVQVWLNGEHNYAKFTIAVADPAPLATVADKDLASVVSLSRAESHRYNRRSCA
jgi:hypothetical protein